MILLQNSLDTEFTCNRLLEWCLFPMQGAWKNILGSHLPSNYLITSVPEKGSTSTLTNSCIDYKKQCQGCTNYFHTARDLKLKLSLPSHPSCILYPPPPPYTPSDPPSSQPDRQWRPPSWSGCLWLLLRWCGLFYKIGWRWWVNILFVCMNSQHSLNGWITDLEWKVSPFECICRFLM